MAILVKKGYGQVEPNHLSAQRTGQIYAQAPADATIEVLENGSFLRMDSSKGTVGVTGNGEWMLVYNEVKLYENRKQGYKDFALLKEESVGGIIVPRLFKTNVGDVFTTNYVDAAGTLGENLVPTAVGGVGMLKTGEAAVGLPSFEITKITTMPDGQTAYKVVRVA